MDLQQQKAAILDALLEHKGVEHVLSAASTVLNNPIMMVSRTGVVVGQSCTDDFGVEYWERFRDALPLQQAISEVETKGLAARLLASDAVISSSFEQAGISVVGTRIRDRIDVLGYISMVTERPPTKTPPRFWSSRRGCSPWSSCTRARVRHSVTRIPCSFTS